ncbi:MAG: VWA domain-containing protein [Acidobacteria bacterium]|nr:VWA domain-containing protein [Acidobacteriota bacterium]
MSFANLLLGQFLVLLGAAASFLLALYLLDRSRRRATVATLRFWSAAEQAPTLRRPKRVEQPLSLLLQLASIALLLLAIAQLRWGMSGLSARDHILLLDTSAWMASRAVRQPGSPLETGSLIDEARSQALAYMRTLPSIDRLMLVRADALATPATPFEPLESREGRRKLEDAIRASAPGVTALNLDQALSFASGLLAQSGRHPGEIVYTGPGRIGERERPRPGRQNLRLLPVADDPENWGLRKIGLRRAASGADRWEISVFARNYGVRPRAATVEVLFGVPPAAVPVGARSLRLEPGQERELVFEYATLAGGLLDIRLRPGDGFPADNRTLIELPPQPSLRVAVYSDSPELLRPVLSAHPRVEAVYRRTADYGEAEPADLVILDGFRPPRRPTVDAIWIDPPEGSPVAVTRRVQNARFARWRMDHALGAGLRARDFKLEAASVFAPAAGDIPIGEVEAGPVILARPGKPKQVVFGFHPARSGLRYELATPLLFANLLRWMSPEIFRHWEAPGGSAGMAALPVEADIAAAGIRVLGEDGSELPFTLRDRTLRFFTPSPDQVRVLAGEREYSYSLRLPQLWQSKWEPPPGSKRGLPSAEPSGFVELWPWLALAGAIGLLADWLLFGRFRRTALGWRRAAAPLPLRRAGP